MKKLAPNRVASYMAALAGLLTALAVPVANLDLQSTAGAVAGLIAILTAYQQWMKGWRSHEVRIAPITPAVAGSRVYTTSGWFQGPPAPGTPGTGHGDDKKDEPDEPDAAHGGT